jgi:hypothetical protein
MDSFVKQADTALQSISINKLNILIFARKKHTGRKRRTFLELEQRYLASKDTPYSCPDSKRMFAPLEE